MTTHWLYPTSPNSKFSLTVGGVQVAVDPGTFAAAVRESGESPDSWIVTTGYRMIAVDDLVWIYFGKPYSYLGGLGRVVHETTERWPDRYMAVDLLWEHAATKALLQNPIAKSAFQDTPRSLRRFGDPAAAMLDRWLSDRP